MTDPTPAPAPNPAPAPAPAPAPEAFDWSKTGVDADTLSYVQAKGFKDPGAVLSSYRNLEKLHGVPAERLLKVPAPDAKPEEIAAYRERLGVPKDPKDYKIAKFEGGSEKEQAAFDSFLRQNFHALGVPASAVEGFTAKWAEFVGNSLKSAEKARGEQMAAEETELKNLQGANYEKFVGVAREAATAFGLSKDHVDALEEAIGFKATMTFLNSIGAKVGESKFAGGGEGAFGGYSVAAAQSEIARLKADTGFAQKIINKDAEALAKWDRLHQIAYPNAA